MLEPDCPKTHRRDPSLRSHTFAELSSGRFCKSWRFAVRCAHVTGAMLMAAPKALARPENAYFAWDRLSDQWPQVGVMGMEAA